MGNRHSLLTLCAFLTGSVAQSQVTITNLGTLPGGSASSATAVSRDGRAVVGESNSAVGGRAFLWTSFGMQVLGTLPLGSYSLAYGVNGDGSAVAGVSDSPGGPHAFRWTAATGMVDLGVLSGANASYGHAISGDGNHVVGYATIGTTQHAFRWSTGTGMLDLGKLPGATDAFAWGVNNDGSVVVGECRFVGGSRAFRWTKATGMQDLGTLTGTGMSLALGVSDDGQVVVGDSTAAVGGRAFRWTQAAGMQDLGVAPGGIGSHGYEVSADGQTIGGESVAAALWKPSIGMVNLPDYLLVLGLDLSGWQLNFVAGVNGDGTAIAGYGTYNGVQRAWLVTGIFEKLRLAPSAETVNLGRVTRGNLGSLGSDDNDSQIVCKFFVPSQASPFVSVGLTFQTPILDPEVLELHTKAKWNNAGSYVIRLLQFNYVSGTEEVILPDTPLAPGYAVYKGVASSSSSNYVNQSTGETHGLIQIRQTGPSTALFPCVEFEYANQIVTR